MLSKLLQQHYLLSEPIQIEPITQGEENRNYHMITPSGRYVLRIYSPMHSTTGARHRTEIEFELHLIDHLRHRSIPTPAVIPTRAGEPFTTLHLDGQTRYAALFAFVPGAEPAAYTPSVAPAVADLLRHMRRAVADFHDQPLRPWPGDIVELSLAYYAQHRPHSSAPYYDQLEALYAATLSGYTQIKANHLPMGVIHGDIKLGNVLFEGDQLNAVIDFDDYRHSYLLEEFTRTVMHDLDSPTRNAIRSGQYPIFYEALINDPSVSAAEKAHLPTFLQARFLYDLTTYRLNRLNRLVDDVFNDTYVKRFLLKSPSPPAEKGI